MEAKIEKFSESRNRVAIIMIINVSMCVVCMILSVQQSFAINEVGDQLILSAYFSGWYNDVCQNRLVGLFSPFLFDFRIHLYNQSLGLLGCPWRERNTILRLTSVSLIIILSLWMLIILLSGNKQKRVWLIFTVMHYILFLSLVITLVLDCDGLYAGFSTCRWNFDIANLDGPVILAFINAQWTTTRAPIWYPGAKTPNMENVQEDSSTNFNQFSIVDYCFLQPYIWTCVADLLCAVFTYIAFKVNSYYKIGSKSSKKSKNKNNEDYQQEEDEDYVDKMDKIEQKYKNKRKKSSISMAEYDANRRYRQDNINNMLAQAEEMEDPDYWHKRNHL